MLENLLMAGDATRTLCVMAHCDDEAVLCGGLLARLAAAGARARVLTVCGRDEQRRAELAAACRCLGCESETLDYADGTLSENLFPEITGRVIEAVRAWKPDLLITHDPDFDYNPDHRFLGRCVPHAAQKAGMSVSGHRPRLLISGEIHTPIPFPDYLVDVSAGMSAALDALACHVSQLDAAHKKGYYTRLFEARARWRGAQAGCEAAMAFRRLALPVIGDVYAEPPAI